MGMGGNENSTFSYLVGGRELVLHKLLRELGRTVTHSTVIAHQLRSAVSLTLRICATQKTINSKAAMNWQNISTRMGMGAGGNGNSQWEWEASGNKTRLNLGLGMGMNHWEWVAIGLKKTFALISHC